MKRVMIFFAMATSLLFAYSEDLYYFDYYYQFSSGSSSASQTSYHSITSDFNTIQLVAGQMLRGIQFTNIGTVMLDRNTSSPSVRFPNFIYRVSDGSLVNYGQCPLIYTLDSIVAGLFVRGYRPSQPSSYWKSYELMHSNSSSFYINCRSLSFVTDALTATNTAFRSYVLDSLGSLSSDVKLLLLNSNSGLVGLDQVVSNTSSLSNLNNIASSVSDSLSKLSVISDASSSLSNLSSISQNSFSALSALQSISSSSESVSLSSAKLSDDFSSSFGYLSPSSYFGNSPWYEDAIRASSLLTPGIDVWSHLLYPNGAGGSDADVRDRYYSDIYKGLFKDRVDSYNRAVASLSDDERRNFTPQQYESLFNDLGSQMRMIADFSYNTPISTNMLRIATNHVVRPLTNEIQKSTTAFTNELVNTKKAITNDLSDIKDILNNMISNNHVIVDNELDHPVPVTIVDPYGMDINFSNLVFDLFGSFPREALSNLNVDVSAIADFTTNELLHIHYNDFYGNGSSFASYPDVMQKVLGDLGIEMNDGYGFWSFQQGATLLNSTILSVFFDMYCSVTNLSASSEWTRDKDGNFMSPKQIAKKAFDAMPSLTQVEDDASTFTNSLSQFSRLSSVTNFLYSCTNSLGGSLENVYTGFDLPPGTIRWFTFHNISFESHTDDIIPALRLLRNGLAFGYSILLLLLLPKFFLFWITHFSNLFLRVLGLSRFRKN